MSDDQNRAESGPMRFGDDWTGLFLRGDNAAYMAFTLEQCVLPKVVGDIRARGIVEDLISTLKQVVHEQGPPENAQVMKPWNEAVSSGQDFLAEMVAERAAKNPDYPRLVEEAAERRALVRKEDT